MSHKFCHRYPYNIILYHKKIIKQVTFNSFLVNSIGVIYKELDIEIPLNKTYVIKTDGSSHSLRALVLRPLVLRPLVLSLSTPSFFHILSTALSRNASTDPITIIVNAIKNINLSESLKNISDKATAIKGATA